MTVLVHFSGPSYSKSVALQPAAPPVDVGRDAQAGVHLPDDDRLISRRHCTLEWAEGGARVTVLSRTSGVTTPRGEFTQGQSVVLEPGETAQLGRFTFLVERADAAAPPVPAGDALQGLEEAAPAARPCTVFDDPAPPVSTPAPASTPVDPWAEFASDWLPPCAKNQKERAAALPPAEKAQLNRAFDDAFSSSPGWHVEDMAQDPLASASFESEKALNAAFSVPSPAAPAGAAAQANGAALQALCRGLGVAGPRELTDAEWERLGQAMRQVVQGLSEVMTVRADMKRELRAADRTMLGTQEANPLKGGMPLQELLHYLLFMPHGAGGYVPAPKALAEAIADLRAHEVASLVDRLRREAQAQQPPPERRG